MNQNLFSIEDISNADKFQHYGGGILIDLELNPDNIGHLDRFQLWKPSSEDLNKNMNDNKVLSRIGLKESSSNYFKLNVQIFKYKKLILIISKKGVLD